MGYMRHHAIVITHWDREQMRTLRNALLEGGAGFRHLISDLIYSETNGYATIFVGPDGSKEGWAESDCGDAFRDRVIDLTGELVPYADWAVIQYGDDNRETRIVSHSDEATKEEEVSND